MDHFAGIKSREPRLSPGALGALYMIASCVVFAGLWAIIRITSEHVSFPIMVFYRNLFGALTLMPMILAHRSTILHTRRHKGHVVRALTGLAASYTTFFAVAVAPLADVVAISYGAPLFTTIAAVFILREKIRARRISAVIIGFIGMLIVLRPGQSELTLGHWSALATALAIAASMITIKMLTQTDSTRTVVAYNFLLMLPISFAIALPFWIWPTWEQFLLLACIGVFATLAQYCMTRSFALAEATSILPFDFIRLVLATILGVILFGERFDIFTILGASIILFASVYLAHREAVARRKAKHAME